jgi:hypothetical protein
MLIAIPLYFFLYAYYFLIFIFLMFYFLNIKHLFFTGSVNLLSFFITFVTLALATLIVFFTWQQLDNVNWQQTITLFNQDWFTFTNINL